MESINVTYAGIASRLCLKEGRREHVPAYAFLGANVLFDAALRPLKEAAPIRYQACDDVPASSLHDACFRSPDSARKVIALTVYGMDLQSLEKVGYELTRKHPDAHFVLGGPGVRDYPHFALSKFERGCATALERGGYDRSSGGLVIVSRGMHEELRDIARALESSSNPGRIAEVAGTRVSVGGEIFESAGSDLIPHVGSNEYLDLLASIDEEMLQRYIPEDRKTAVLSLTLGCAHGACSMCQGPAHPYRAPTPQHYERIIEMLPPHVECVQLLGNITARNAKELGRLFDRIGDQEKVYSIVIRLDQVLSNSRDSNHDRIADKSFIRKLRHSGVAFSEAGLENLDADINRRLGKSLWFSPVEARRALDGLSQAMVVDLDCMSFDNVASIEEFLHGLQLLGKLENVDLTLQQEVTPYKGTKECAKLLDFVKGMHAKGHRLRQFEETPDGLRSLEGIPIHPNPFLFMVSMISVLEMLRTAKLKRRKKPSRGPLGKADYWEMRRAVIHAFRCYRDFLTGMPGRRAQEERKLLARGWRLFREECLSGRRVPVQRSKAVKVRVPVFDEAVATTAYKIPADRELSGEYWRIIKEELRKRGLDPESPSLVRDWLETFDEVRGKWDEEVLSRISRGSSVHKRHSFGGASLPAR